MRRLLLVGVLIGLLAAISGSATAAPRSCAEAGGFLTDAHGIGCPTYRSAAVVLGGRAFGAPTGEGWGTAHPRTIFNGGDPSGLITDVYWSSWGSTTARGTGRNPIFKPHGGYYRHAVRIELEAKRLGQCEGRRAYLKLFVREPSKPGGPLGPWRSWSGAKDICHAPY